MGLSRYANRRDNNEREVTAALETVGAHVIRWDKVDLIVGYRGRTFLLEVTNADGVKKGGRSEHARKQRQLEWRLRWPGHCVEVFSPADALRAIGAEVTTTADEQVWRSRLG